MENDSEEFQRGIRDNIRAECRRKLEECARDSNSALSLSNVAEIEHAGFSEEALAFARTEGQKTDKLQEWLEEYIPVLIQEARQAGQIAAKVIDEADQKHWILKSSADDWRRKIKEGKWMEKKTFILGTEGTYNLRAFKDNWEKIANDSKDVKDREKKLGILPEEARTIPELKDFHAPLFRDGSLSYADRRKIVNKAQAYLEARQKTEGPLKQAIAAKQERVQENMKTVDAVPQIRAACRKNAEKVVGGEGKKGKNAEGHLAFLEELLQGWPRIREFARLEERRKKEGTPRSFHFVSFSVFFFNWSNGQQQTYLQEGGRSFIDVMKERGIVLKIRHELAAEDWDEAEALIADAKRAKNLTDEDRAKIRSMEEYLHEHSGGERRFDAKEKPDPAAIYAKMHQALRGISSQSVRERYELSMGYDYQTAWAYMTQVYNWKWCRLHGYSDDKIDERFRQSAKAETYQHLKYGQPRGYANNDFTSDTSIRPAARSDHDTSSPQVVNVSAATNNPAFIRWVHENNNKRAVWYWTRCVTKDFSYNQTLNVIDNVHPVLKWGMRKLKELNVPYMTEAELKQSPLSRHTSAAPSAKASPKKRSKGAWETHPALAT